MDLSLMAEVLLVVDARCPTKIGTQALVGGWVRTRRDSKGGFSFLELNDGSSQGSLQIVCDSTLPNYIDEIQKLSAGCSVRCRGEIKASAGQGQATELHASDVTVLGWADPLEYPLQKKRHSFEKLREWAHLRPRTNSFSAVTRVRNCISRSIHQFFQERKFLYIQTPIITSSDCEGAGEMFKVTTLDLEKLSKSGRPVDYSQDFFERPAFLTVSGQLEGETFACGMGRIYTFGPTFRAENSNTSRHLAEFWMVEPEMAFFELTDNMDLAEAFLKRISLDVLQNCLEDLEFFVERIDKEVIQSLHKLVNDDFVRMSYTEAIQVLETSGHTFEYPIAWGSDLQSEHERYLTEVHCHAPVILYNYPRSIKPFYMHVNDDEKTVRAMDVLVPRVGEIIGGSQREARLDVLEQRMREQRLDPQAYWWYLDLRRYGTVPHSGFGLGLERAVQFVSGMANIRDVIPFPRTPGNAEF
ncbi:MAG: asparagine--tRNA ligase [Planctomycetota bacterium]|nr:asparagine--tRNA ligase [Planctomycetota bacterium]